MRRRKETCRYTSLTFEASIINNLKTEIYLGELAKRGSREKYDAVLAKVPDIEPESYDRLPTA